ncbi:hypothetical protein [Pedobacter cryoconitis]|uniref:Uncharacterized protein n=1 Tax=Pedobacter cryoconitis TaxID=188932 RepID=A0A7X0J114_9SPHI|nr:hypothetical protein [Pedobacter cryoconitis]MBB6498714.1 hypothetical protein [Pedobacter cryoconitis]
MIKKAFIAAVIGILLLLLAVYGYLQYRQYSSYQNSIPRNASLIFKINVDRIVKRKRLNPFKSSSRGFAVPANIFIYNLNNQPTETFFCTLPVTDTALLKQYLKNEFRINQLTEIQPGVITGKSSDHRLRVIYNSSRLILSYALFKEDTSPELERLLNEKDQMIPGDQRVDRLKNQMADITYDFKTYTGAANFNDHILTLNGSFPLEELGVPDSSYQPAKLHQNLSMKMWLNADLRKVLQKDIRFKTYFLEKDSILKYYDGYTAVECGTLLSQYEPVVTYEYNDEFEKVEKKQLKEVKVPEISITCKIKSPALINYLQKQTIISSENKFNKELFPLYQVYSMHNSKLWQLSTNQTKNLSPALQTSPYFAFAAINFEQLRKQNQFPFLNTYTRYLKQLKLKATKQTPTDGKIELELQLSEKAAL